MMTISTGCRVSRRRGVEKMTKSTRATSLHRLFFDRLEKRGAIIRYVSSRAETNSLHRLSMIDDAQKQFPEINLEVIGELVDYVIDNFCRESNNCQCNQQGAGKHRAL
jgi:hypothetical protein